MHLATVATAVPFPGAALPVFADGLGPGAFFVVAAPLAVVGVAMALAVVLVGVWLARRGRKPTEGN